MHMQVLTRLKDRFGHGLAQGHTGLIGIEFAREQLNLVQAEAGEGGEVWLRAWASEPYGGAREELLASPGRLRRVLRRVLRSGRFVGHRAVSALPSSDTRILSMSYRPGGQEDGAAILKAVQGRIEGEVSDYVIDYLPVRANREDEEHLAIVALAPRESVIGFLEVVRKSGLDIEALEIGPAAIKRLVVTLSGDAVQESVLVVNFGMTNSYLTMISGRRLLFDQVVELGEQDLIHHLSDALELPAALAKELVFRHGLEVGTTQGGGEDVSHTLREILTPKFQALVKEINRSLIFAASETHGEAVGRVYILGGVARWPGVDVMLNEMLDIPVAKIPDPLRSFRRLGCGVDADSGEGVPELAVATGLALRGMVSNG